MIPRARKAGQLGLLVSKPAFHTPFCDILSKPATPPSSGSEPLTVPPSFNILTDDPEMKFIVGKAHTERKELFPIDGNDKWGDCLCAAVAHAATVFHGMVNKLFVPEEYEVINKYKEISGATTPPGPGLRSRQVLEPLKHKGLFGEKIMFYVPFDPRNHEYMKLAIRYLGGVFIGFNFQKSDIKTFEDHKPWDFVPGDLDGTGHAVFAYAYDDTGIDMFTWGSEQHGTWNWVDKRVDEAYAILPLEAHDKSFVYVDYKQLKHLIKDLPS